MVKGRKKQEGPLEQDDLVFKALAGADRRKILDLLRDTPMTTGELGKRLPWLDRRWNYLDVSPIQRIHERWIQAYAMPSASMLSKLQQDLETLQQNS
jgi:DNA-binding transcriptional ArsR family regulator